MTVSMNSDDYVYPLLILHHLIVSAMSFGKKRLHIDMKAGRSTYTTRTDPANGLSMRVRGRITTSSVVHAGTLSGGEMYL